AFADPRPDVVLALHTFNELDGAEATVGKVGVTPGPSYAAVDHFVATLHGKGAHGARPHQSVDPVVMAAQAIEALQTIRSRNLDPFAPSVVTVGIVHAGERYNIIPSEARLEGTV